MRTCVNIERSYSDESLVIGSSFSSGIGAVLVDTVTRLCNVFLLVKAACDPLFFNFKLIMRGEDVSTIALWWCLSLMDKVYRFKNFLFFSLLSIRSLVVCIFLLIALVKDCSILSCLKLLNFCKTDQNAYIK